MSNPFDIPTNQGDTWTARMDVPDPLDVMTRDEALEFAMEALEERFEQLTRNGASGGDKGGNYWTARQVLEIIQGECARCDGTGEELISPFDNPHDDVSVTCRSCGGTGKS